MKAVEATGDQISSIILNTAKAWLPARALVEKAVKQRKQYDDKGAILVFEQGGMPWKVAQRRIPIMSLKGTAF